MHQKRNGETTRQPREISRRIFEGGRYGSLFGNNFRNWKTKWETLFRYYEAICLYIYIYIRISSGKDFVIRLSSRIPRFSRKVCSSSSLSPPRGDKSSVRESVKDTKSVAFPGLEFPSLGIRNRSIFSARSTRTQPAHF